MGGHAKFDKTDPPLQSPAPPVSGLSRSALLAKSHSREEARRSVSGEAGPVRIIARVPLHPAWTGHPDARSSDRFELHHDPVQPTGLTCSCRSNCAGHFQGEGREAERGGTSSDGRDDRLVPASKVRSVRVCDLVRSVPLLVPLAPVLTTTCYPYPPSSR